MKILVNNKDYGEIAGFNENLRPSSSDRPSSLAVNMTDTSQENADKMCELYDIDITSVKIIDGENVEVFSSSKYNVINEISRRSNGSDTGTTVLLSINFTTK